MPANRTPISATTSSAATLATMAPITSPVRCSVAPSRVAGGPAASTTLSGACMASPDIASIFLEEVPCLVAELGSPLLVEGRLCQSLPERVRISLVEGQPFLLQDFP